MHNNHLRCTICTWRGLLEDALAAPRVRRSQIPRAMEPIQAAYADTHAASTRAGSPEIPPCPSCGNQLTKAQYRGRRPSFHPGA